MIDIESRLLYVQTLDNTQSLPPFILICALDSGQFVTISFHLNHSIRRNDRIGLNQRFHITNIKRKSR